MTAAARCLAAFSNALASSSGLSTLSERIFSFSSFAASCVSSRRPVPGLEGSEMAGIQRNATCGDFGNASLTSDNRRKANSGDKLDNPVRFPPGRARLTTSPDPTGSPPITAMTIGISVVAFLAAKPTGLPPPPVTMTSTLRRTSSAASSGRRSNFPSAPRYSITMFLPSNHPRSLRPSLNASSPNPRPAPCDRYPMTGIFFICCASAMTPKASRTRAITIERMAAR